MIDDDEGSALYLCKQDCYDGTAYYEKGKSYPIDPTADVAVYFKVPDSAKKKDTPKK